MFVYPPPCLPVPSVEDDSMRMARLIARAMPCALCCLLPLLLGSMVAAEDGGNWPAFRGPHGDGTADAKLPLRWSDDGEKTENVRWKTAIHGRGWSSPVVWGDQIWLTTATEDGKKQFAVCVDAATGEIRHDIVVFENEKPEYCHPTNSYASPTPVVEKGRVYVNYGSYGTAALDSATGEILWTRRDLHCNHFRAPGSSPVLFEDVLIVPFDGIDVQYVVGLDKHTGKTLWNTPRNIDSGTDNGDAMTASATAALIEVAGQPQAVIPSAGATIAYEPRTGKEIWRVHHGGMNAASRPVYANGLVYISGGEGGMAFVVVRPDGHGDVTDTHVAWTSRSMIPKRPSQVVVGDLLFMTNDSGVVTCRDAKTGEMHWTKRVEGGEFWASPLSADGRVYFFSKEGHTSVIAAKKEFELLADNKLPAGFNASPAVIGNDLILRTFTHLYRIGE
jgi:outer membrane protein assembly factor BamB